MNRGANFSIVMGVAVSVAAAACGSTDPKPEGGGAGSCGVTPCGGDVVGTWEGSSACVDRARLEMDFLAGVMGSCANASLGNVTLTPSGTVSIAADMTFSGAISVDTMTEINFPAECTAGGNCVLLTQLLQSLVGMLGITSVSCTGSGGCTCTMAQTFPLLPADTGTWSTSGTTLTLTGAGVTSQLPYCEQGTSLHLPDLDMTPMMKVVGDTILTRR
jgi:hypothetical protein